MAKLTAADASGIYSVLSETANVTTDAAGRFSYTTIESYASAPNVQCQAQSAATGTLAAMNALQATTQAPTAATPNAASSVYTISGIVTGTNALSIAGVSVLQIAQVTYPATVQLMILGR